MTTALVNGHIVIDRATATGMAVLIEGGRISDVVAANAVPKGSKVCDLHDGTLLPGFVDIQVNGGGGVLFNDDSSVQALRTIGNAHSRFGTTGFLPTIVSADFAAIAKAIAAVDDAIAACVPGVLGIHIEGPFLKRGTERHSRLGQFRRTGRRGLCARHLAQARQDNADAGARDHKIQA